jgi:hypothetical protein|tara:strand:+ start:4231 stop:4458 length:228 start_codon:yes stop_codon:yes gene_type:complete
MTSGTVKIIVGSVIAIVISLILMPTIISSIDTTITAISGSSNTYAGVSSLLQLVPLIFVAGILGFSYLQIKKNRD